MSAKTWFDRPGRSLRPHLLGLVLVAAAAGAAAAGEPRIRLVPGAPNEPARFEVTGVPAKTLQAFAGRPAADPDWADLFGVYVADAPASDIAMLGSYRVADGVLRFTPRFPLTRGLRYKAILKLEPPGGDEKPAGGRRSIVEEVSIPEDTSTAPAQVERIYPSAARLPENLLRLYLVFTAPMSRGEAYRHLELRTASGQKVELPFLEIGEELWDPAGKRLTLLLDPGRVKRGLRPREEEGPILVAGKEYILTVRAGWRDATGKPLGSEFRKRFVAGPAVETGIDVQEWKLAPAPAGAKRPLVVRFPRPLDRALLEHTLTVQDGAGRPVEGTVTVADGEQRWEFQPRQPWQAGSYRLVVETRLEDVSGNSVGRPFEVDEQTPVTKQVTTPTVTILFIVAAAPRP